MCAKVLGRYLSDHQSECVETAQRLHYTNTVDNSRQECHLLPESQSDVVQSQSDYERWELTVKFIKGRLEAAARQARFYENILAHIPVKDRGAIKIPEQSSRAWLHLIMFLILLSVDDRHDQWRKHLNHFNTLMNESRTVITKTFIRKPLVNKLTLLPMDIALLASFNMLQDLTNDRPNIEETYSIYLNQLVSLLDSHTKIQLLTK